MGARIAFDEIVCPIGPISYYATAAVKRTRNKSVGGVFGGGVVSESRHNIIYVCVIFILFSTDRRTRRCFRDISSCSCLPRPFRSDYTYVHIYIRSLYTPPLLLPLPRRHVADDDDDDDESRDGRTDSATRPNKTNCETARNI